MLSGDDLTIVLFFIGTAITIALAAMNAAGWRHPVLIRGLFGVAAFCVFIGMTWPILKTFSPSTTTIVNQVATSPVAWFVVLMFGIATLLLRPADGWKSVSTQSVDFVKNILIDAHASDAAALFNGTASRTFDRIT
jgi:cyanate permease